MGYFVYILKSSSSGKYYVGSTENPERRLTYHNTIEKGFISRYRPWHLVWQQGCLNKVEAQTAERKIKSWKSKMMIEKVVAGEINI